MFIDKITSVFISGSQKADHLRQIGHAQSANRAASVKQRPSPLKRRWSGVALGMLLPALVLYVGLLRQPAGAASAVMQGSVLSKITFVNAVYNHVLDRPANATELRTAEDMLNSGQSGEAVALSVLTSTEARQKLGRSLYQELNRRAPFSFEITNFVNLLNGGMTDEQAASQIIGSTEYFNLCGGTNRDFVKQNYIDLLGRLPNATEEATNLNQLNSGQTREQFAQDIQNDDEFQRLELQAVYKVALGRDPTDSEIAADLAARHSGIIQSTEQFESQLMGSSEFQQGLTGVPVYEDSTNPFIFRTFTSPSPSAQASDFTVTLTTGDGATATGTLTPKGSNFPGIFYVSTVHSYSTPGQYSVAGQITDKSGGTTPFTAPIVVRDAPLSSFGGRFFGTVGSLSTGEVATFTDLNPNATASGFTATVDWGDGTPGTGPVTGNATEGFHVNGSHQFPTAGDYAINVTITDKNGSTATAFSRATIGPHFTVSSPSTTVTVQPGTKVKLKLNINRTGGFTGPVTVTATSPVDGIKVPDPFTTTDDSVKLKDKFAGRVPLGPYLLPITFRDSFGNTQTFTFTANVTNQ